MRSRKDYTTIQCKQCDCDIDVWKYDLTRKTPHRGLCKECAIKKRSIDMIAKTDRDDIYLKKQLRNIKARCSGKYDNYSSYTRKGISVCPEWMNSSDAFVRWAKDNGWDKELTIDRIDNNGNYEPSNCRWITNKQNILESESSRVSRGASKYIGIWFRKDTEKWSAEIKIDSKKISLGSFDDELSAAAYRDMFIDINQIPYLKKNDVTKKGASITGSLLRNWSNAKIEELIFDHTNGMSVVDIENKYGITRNQARNRQIEALKITYAKRKYILP